MDDIKPPDTVFWLPVQIFAIASLTWEFWDKKSAWIFLRVAAAVWLFVECCLGAFESSTSKDSHTIKMEETFRERLGIIENTFREKLATIEENSKTLQEKVLIATASIKGENEVLKAEVVQQKNALTFISSENWPIRIKRYEKLESLMERFQGAVKTIPNLWKDLDAVKESAVNEKASMFQVQETVKVEKAALVKLHGEVAEGQEKLEQLRNTMVAEQQSLSEFHDRIVIEKQSTTDLRAWIAKEKQMAKELCDSIIEEKKASQALRDDSESHMKMTKKLEEIVIRERTAARRWVDKAVAEHLALRLFHQELCKEKNALQDLLAKKSEESSSTETLLNTILKEFEAMKESQKKLLESEQSLRAEIGSLKVKGDQQDKLAKQCGTHTADIFKLQSKVTTNSSSIQKVQVDLEERLQLAEENIQENRKTHTSSLPKLTKKLAHDSLVQRVNALEAKASVQATMPASIPTPQTEQSQSLLTKTVPKAPGRVESAAKPSPAQMTASKSPQATKAAAELQKLVEKTPEATKTPAATKAAVTTSDSQKAEKKSLEAPKAAEKMAAPVNNSQKSLDVQKGAQNTTEQLNPDQGIAGPGGVEKEPTPAPTEVNKISATARPKITIKLNMKKLIKDSAETTESTKVSGSSIDSTEKIPGPGLEVPENSAKAGSKALSEPKPKEQVLTAEAKQNSSFATKTEPNSSGEAAKNVDSTKKPQTTTFSDYESLRTSKGNLFSPPVANTATTNPSNAANFDDSKDEPTEDSISRKKKTAGGQPSNASLIPLPTARRRLQNNSKAKTTLKVVSGPRDTELDKPPRNIFGTSGLPDVDTSAQTPRPQFAFAPNDAGGSVPNQAPSNSGNSSTTQTEAKPFVFGSKDSTAPTSIPVASSAASPTTTGNAVQPVPVQNHPFTFDGSFGGSSTTNANSFQRPAVAKKPISFSITTGKPFKPLPVRKQPTTFGGSSTTSANKCQPPPASTPQSSLGSSIGDSSATANPPESLPAALHPSSFSGSTSIANPLESLPAALHPSSFGTSLTRSAEPLRFLNNGGAWNLPPDFGASLANSFGLATPARGQPAVSVTPASTNTSKMFEDVIRSYDTAPKRNIDTSMSQDAPPAANNDTKDAEMGDSDEDVEWENVITDSTAFSQLPPPPPPEFAYPEEGLNGVNGVSNEYVDDDEFNNSFGAIASTAPAYAPAPQELDLSQLHSFVQNYTVPANHLASAAAGVDPCAMNSTATTYNTDFSNTPIDQSIDPALDGQASALDVDSGGNLTYTSEPQQGGYMTFDQYVESGGNPEDFDFGELKF